MGEQNIEKSSKGKMVKTNPLIIVSIFLSIYILAIFFPLFLIFFISEIGDGYGAGYVLFFLIVGVSLMYGFLIGVWNLSPKLKLCAATIGSLSFFGAVFLVMFFFDLRLNIDRDYEEIILSTIEIGTFGLTSIFIALVIGWVLRIGYLFFVKKSHADIDYFINNKKRILIFFVGAILLVMILNTAYNVVVNGEGLPFL